MLGMLPKASPGLFQGLQDEARQDPDSSQGAAKPPNESEHGGEGGLAPTTAGSAKETASGLRTQPDGHECGNAGLPSSAAQWCEVRCAEGGCALGSCQEGKKGGPDMLGMSQALAEKPWKDLWSTLKAQGWSEELGSAGLARLQKYYMPPGVHRGAGSKVRVHYFDSMQQVRRHVRLKA